MGLTSTKLFSHVYFSQNFVFWGRFAEINKIKFERRLKKWF